MINCTKDDFLNAFSGNEIIHGIEWLVIAKNKKVSKHSLFYFINELINKSHLSKRILNDLSKYVKYTFRDNKGKELENLKQHTTKPY